MVEDIQFLHVVAHKVTGEAPAEAQRDRGNPECFKDARNHDAFPSRRDQFILHVMGMAQSQLRDSDDIIDGRIQCDRVNHI
ncbi:hypothetical protein SDC9_161565 [bioreactor metagenome]|uniref:Uncharacterized protein n=1 Tax=bioreactor metagenome TaxID=1076179 RepID=A0A645FLM2_9ZZZZ